MEMVTFFCIVRGHHLGYTSMETPVFLWCLSVYLSVYVWECMPGMQMINTFHLFQRPLLIKDASLFTAIQYSYVIIGLNPTIWWIVVWLNLVQFWNVNFKEGVGSVLFIIVSSCIEDRLTVDLIGALFLDWLVRSDWLGFSLDFCWLKWMRVWKSPLTSTAILISDRMTKISSSSSCSSCSSCSPVSSFSSLSSISFLYPCKLPHLLIWFWIYYTERKWPQFSIFVLISKKVNQCASGFSIQHWISGGNNEKWE